MTSFQDESSDELIIPQELLQRIKQLPINDSNDGLTTVQHLFLVLTYQFEIIEKQQAFLKEKDDRLNEKDDRIEELQKRLRRYENPHTPPSLEKRFLKKKTAPNDDEEVKVDRRKRGHRKHPGSTREVPEPIDTEVVTAKECPRCFSKDIEDRGTVDKIIEDISKALKHMVILFKRHEYECNNCGHEFVASHKGCPNFGIFGINLLVYITMLKFFLRGPIRKVREFVLLGNNFPISVKGINDALLRVGKACKSEYKRTINRIRKSKWVHIDETTMKVEKKKYWLWVFRTSTDILVVIRDSRGGKVVKEILGENYKGVAIVDGWPAYSYLKKIQRCWAHLLREVDECKDTKEGERLSSEIHRLFNELKEYLASTHRKEERRRQKVLFDEKIKGIWKKFSRYPSLYSALKYIENGLGNWFTCVEYSDVEPTNNPAEQAIREHVIIRKIIGMFRSVKGAENYQYISSMLATWNQRGLNLFDELKTLLELELCGT